jgi:hypothetical protein
MPFRPLQTDDEILTRARDGYEAARDGNEHIRAEMRENLRFSLNDQWSQEAKNLRAGKRPMYVFNIVDRLVDAVAGDGRENPITGRLFPVGHGDRFEAWLKEGMVRAIIGGSKGTRAFAWALECGARLCEGYFELDADYESERSLKPTLKVVQGDDPFDYLLDPRAMSPTGSDADYGFKLKKYTRDEFRENFGEENEPTENDDLGREMLRHWYEMAGKESKDVKKYLVAQFWWRETAEKWIGETEAGDVVDLDGKPTEYEGLPWGSVNGEWLTEPLVSARKVKGVRIRCAFVAGHKVLPVPEEAREKGDPANAWTWPGRRIPIFRVSGKQIIGDGKRSVKSAITNARDPQRALNTAFTAQIEAANSAPMSKWLVVWKSVSKYWAKYWEKANDPSTNALPYDPDAAAPNGGKPEWVANPVEIGSHAAIGEQMLGVTRFTTGLGEETSGLKSNATSGRQEQLRLQESQKTSSAFPTNLQAAVEELVEEIVYLLPKFYVGTRLVQAVLEEDSAIPEPVSIPLGRAPTPEELEPIARLAEAKGITVPQALDALRLKEGEYNVVVSVSRSWVTRRVETQEVVMGMLQYLPPEMIPDAVELMLGSTDLPGGQQLADRISKRREQAEKDAQAQTAADAVLKAITTHPMFAAVVEGIQRKTLKAMLEGQAGGGPGMLPAPEGEPPGGPLPEVPPEVAGMMGLGPEMVDPSLMEGPEVL